MRKKPFLLCFHGARRAAAAPVVDQVIYLPCSPLPILRCLHSLVRADAHRASASTKPSTGRSTCLFGSSSGARRSFTRTFFCAHSSGATKTTRRPSTRSAYENALSTCFFGYQHVDGEAGAAQLCGEADGVKSHLVVEGDHDEVEVRRERRQHPFLAQQLHHDAVAEAEAARRHHRRRAVQREQLVVPPAATDRAQLALAVEALEDDPGVVREAAHDRSVEVEPVGEAVLAGDAKSVVELGDGVVAELARQRAQFLDRLERERLDDLRARRPPGIPFGVAISSSTVASGPILSSLSTMTHTSRELRR